MFGKSNFSLKEKVHMGRFRRGHGKHYGKREEGPRSLALLSTCRVGEEGEIAEIVGTPLFTARLRELGIVPGESIRILRAGCPMIVQVGEARLAIRKKDAAGIRIYLTRAADLPVRTALHPAEAA